VWSPICSSGTCRSVANSSRILSSTATVPPFAPLLLALLDQSTDRADVLEFLHLDLVRGEIDAELLVQEGQNFQNAERIDDSRLEQWLFVPQPLEVSLGIHLGHDELLQLVLEIRHRSPPRRVDCPLPPWR